MRGRFTILLALVLISASGGCRSCDLVEAELRTLERDLRELKSELFRSEACNDALQREVGVLRQGNPGKVTPEEASQQYTLRQIVLGRGTGGHDGDSLPGDEGLQIVLEPRDGDNHAIKSVGVLYVEVLEINREGLKTFLSSWDIPPEKLRQTWRSGLLSSGYHIVLPWKTWPTCDKLRILTRFTLADGRTFEADKDVTIRPTPPSGRKNPALAPPTSSPADAELPLPLPRKVEPSKTPESQARWWDPQPQSTEPQPTSTLVWKAKKQKPLNESIELGRPVPLTVWPAPTWTP